MKCLPLFLFALGFMLSSNLMSQNNGGAKGNKLQMKQEMTENKDKIISHLDTKYDYYRDRALEIWGYAEVGYKEYKSSELLQKTLEENGFAVESGVAGIPNAFVATYGSGKPVIG